MNNEATTATTTPGAHAKEIKGRLEELVGYMNDGAIKDEVDSIIEELRGLSNYLIGLNMRAPNHRGW